MNIHYALKETFGKKNIWSAVLQITHCTESVPLIKTMNVQVKVNYGFKKIVIN